MHLLENRMKAWGNCIFAVIICVCFFDSLSIAKGFDNTEKTLLDAVVEGIKANTAKLDCAVISWRSELSHFGALADRIGPEDSYQLQKGTYQLWWKGKKTAVNSRTDSLTYGENVKPSVSTNKVRMVYDGKVFRAKSPRPQEPEMSDVLLHKDPRFKQGDNYLREIGWENRAESLIKRLTFKGPRTPGPRHFSIEVGDDGSKLVKYAFNNSKTGQVGFRYYDIGKSYALVRYENYASETQLAARIDYRYEQIAGGAWFPVEVTTTGFNITNGEKTSSNKMVVDVSKSVFNDPLAVPDEVFELEIGKNAEISDFLHGERLLYSTDVTPLATETLDDLVDEFLVSDGKIEEDKIIEHNKSVDIKLPDDSHTHAGNADDGHTHDGDTVQHNSLGNEIPWLALSLILFGVVACVIVTVLWMRRSR